MLYILVTMKIVPTFYIISCPYNFRRQYLLKAKAANSISKAQSVSVLNHIWEVPIPETWLGVYTLAQLVGQVLKAITNMTVPGVNEYQIWQPFIHTVKSE